MNPKLELDEEFDELLFQRARYRTTAIGACL
jgi:hypothetical protein